MVPRGIIRDYYNFSCDSKVIYIRNYYVDCDHDIFNLPHDMIKNPLHTRNNPS